MLGVVIGVIAGLGAVVFYEALVLCTRFFLGVLVGYRVPSPAGEGGSSGRPSAARLWLLPLITGLGALLGALLVFGIAPEAQGHGTDAAISRRAPQPARAPLARGRREDRRLGPHHRLGRLRRPRRARRRRSAPASARCFPGSSTCEPADSRVAVATGIGSGIGAIFGAPLGGAVLAAEILYRDDFDPTALLPCFIASAVSYAIFGAVEGFAPLFGYVGGYRFSDSSQLAWFALLGILGGLLGLLYAKGFYGMVGLFARSPLPRWAGPAIGGVAGRRDGPRHPRGARHRLRLGAEGPRTRACSRSRCGSS